MKGFMCQAEAHGLYVYTCDLQILWTAKDEPEGEGGKY